MSDTPRTDAETMRDEYDHVDTEFGAFAPSDTVSADFARQLERELTEVTKQRDELADERDALVKAIREHKAAVAFTISDCDELLYKALEERELAEVTKIKL